MRYRNGGMVCWSGRAIKIAVDMIRGKKGIVLWLVGLGSRVRGVDCGTAYVACVEMSVIR